MQKIGLLVLFAMILAACDPSDNDLAITRAQKAIEAARTAQISTQGASDIVRVQTLVLALLLLVVVVSISLILYLAARWITRFQRITQMLPSGHWMHGPNAQWKKPMENDLSQQILLDQEWLLTQLLTQGHEDADAQDTFDLPTDWWG